MDDEHREKSLETLRDDTGMGPREKGSTNEAARRLNIRLAASEEAYSAEEQEKHIREEARLSEAKRVAEAIASLGLTKEEFVDHFPTMADNYVKLQRTRAIEGVDLKSIEGKNNELFFIQFSTIISLLESDHELSQELSTRWGTELFSAIAAHDEVVKNRRR